MPWDYEMYCKVCDRRALGEGHSPKERKLAEEFQSWAASLKSITKPRTVVDTFGRVIAWILPEILPQRLQVSQVRLSLHTALTSHDIFKKMLYDQSANLGPELRSELMRARDKQSVPWRHRSELFESKEEGIPIGLLNLSPAWFMAGWQVCPHNAGKFR